MSNPTILVESFDGTLGGFTGVEPIRYDGGLEVEQATTNYIRNPLTYSASTGWGNSGKGAGISATLAWNAGPPASVRWTVTSVDISGGGYMEMSYTTSVGTFAEGDPCTASALVTATGATASVRAAIWPLDAAGAIIGSATNGSLIAADSNPHILTCTIPSLPASTSRVAVYVKTAFGANDALPSTVDVYWSQVEKLAYATSICPEVDGSGMPEPGYAFTGTAHASISTRAASSASVTIAEPAAVACWYREAYSGAKSFAYLEPYGTLGTYGSIAYAAGDLTISTSRNLVIGPFAAFDRELTSKEQANLQRTQNWTNKTVFGPNPYTTYQMRPY